MDSFFAVHVHDLIVHVRACPCPCKALVKLKQIRKIRTPFVIPRTNCMSFIEIYCHGIVISLEHFQIRKGVMNYATALLIFI